MSKGYDEISKQGWVEDAQPYRGRSAAGAAAVALANAAWRLNVADLVPAWTPKGKQLARERGANSANTRVNVSAGTFLMGSTKRVDRNEYLTEIRLAIRRRGIINPAWRTTPPCTSTTAEGPPIFT